MEERNSLLMRIVELTGDSLPFDDASLEELRVLVGELEFATRLIREKGRMGALWSLHMHLEPRSDDQ